MEIVIGGRPEGCCKLSQEYQCNYAFDSPTVDGKHVRLNGPGFNNDGGLLSASTDWTPLDAIRVDTLRGDTRLENTWVTEAVTRM